MKSSIVLLSAAIGLAAATQHHHGHQHAHQKKEASPVAEAEAGPTVVLYSYNGVLINEEEVMEGIKNGSLVWANGAPHEASAAAPSTSTAWSVYDTPSSSSERKQAPTTSFVTSTSVYVAPISTAVSSAVQSVSVSSAAAKTSSAASSKSSSSSSSGSSASGCEKPFPDGKISCSSFPSDYGALAVDHLGLGGWIGIQHPKSTLAEGFADISNMASGSCEDGKYCSYACPPGYQKSQWPSTQGSTGQSVGGLLCKNGLLYKTNSDYDTICIKGASAVTILVRNEMNTNAAVCRTDYPGTESETVPLNAEAGSTNNLTCPDGGSYYKWGKASTSAQYYVNPAGVSVKDGCQWGSSSNPWGNYAPVNIGVGYSNGAAWLSIFQNYPTTTAELDFTIEIQGTDGNMNGNCRYSKGQFCSGPNYSNCNTRSGCTVSVSKGTATYVFSS